MHKSLEMEGSGHRIVREICEDSIIRERAELEFEDLPVHWRNIDNMKVAWVEVRSVLPNTPQGELLDLFGLLPDTLIREWAVHDKQRFRRAFEVAITSITQENERNELKRSQFIEFEDQDEQPPDDENKDV